MKRLINWCATLGLLVAVVAPALGAASPVVRMPALEQGSQVRGDVLVDIVVKPADDGAPLTKLDVSLDSEAPVVSFVLEPAMRNVTYNWQTARWSDGRHDLVATVVDSKGRVGTYKTFVYVWNQGRPKAVGEAPAQITVQDSDGNPDGIITQRAMIQVKVDPKLGAKWVIVYLNDSLLAMMNYPPYQVLLDPVKRHMADGPYVVRARVVHPDNSETEPDPVRLQVNMSGNYTPVKGMGPAPAPIPTTPGPLAPAPQAVPVPAPAPAPVPTVVPAARPVPTVTDMPVAAPPSVAQLPGGPPAVVGVDRPAAAGRAMSPTIRELGAVDLGPLNLGAAAPQATPAATLPVANVPVPAASKAAYRSRRQDVPVPARTAFEAATLHSAPQDSLVQFPGASGAAAAERVSTPPTRLRPPAPRVLTGAVVSGELATAGVAGALATALGNYTAAGLPGRRERQPRMVSGVWGTAPAPRAEAGLATPGVAAGADAIRTVAVPAGDRRVAEPRVAGGQVVGAAPVPTPAVTTRSLTKDATTVVVGPATPRRVASPVAVAGGRPATGTVVTATTAGPTPGAEAGSRLGAPSTASRQTPRTAIVATTVPTTTVTVPAVGASTVPAIAPPAVPAPSTSPRVTPPTRVGPPAPPVKPQGAPPTPPVTRTTITVARQIGRFHTVHRGDTLYSIAKRYDVTVKDLVKVNNIHNSRVIRDGQRLVIPGGNLLVNGAPVATDVRPLVHREGISASPLRFVVEALGGSVSWIGPAQQVQATTKDRGVLTITVGSADAKVNDEHVLMDLAAYLEHGRTMVPTRFISQALDVTIEVDEQSGNILVRSNR